MYTIGNFLKWRGSKTLFKGASSSWQMSLPWFWRGSSKPAKLYIVASDLLLIHNMLHCDVMQLPNSCGSLNLLHKCIPYYITCFTNITIARMLRLLWYAPLTLIILGCKRKTHFQNLTTLTLIPIVASSANFFCNFLFSTSRKKCNILLSFVNTTPSLSLLLNLHSQITLLQPPRPWRSNCCCFSILALILKMSKQ